METRKDTREWRLLDWEECPNCGASIRSLTSAGCPFNMAFDGDRVECADGCGEVGSVCVDGDEHDEDGQCSSAHVIWAEDSK